MKIILSFLGIIILTSIIKNVGYSQTVTIGTQVWMTKNLDVSVFRNGDTIPEAKTEEEWQKAGENKQPAWCYNENDTVNGVKYGKLYNWYAVIDSRGLAPAGYHIPSDSEWTILTDYLGGEAGGKMKSTNEWFDNGNGSNTSGFSGLPGGKRGSDGTFYHVGGSGYWWSSSEDGANTYRQDDSIAWYRDLNCLHNDVKRNSNNKRKGFSVRCLGD
jgi:uncharacterized protein (TIGR02145 family)